MRNSTTLSRFEDEAYDVVAGFGLGGVGFCEHGYDVGVVYEEDGDAAGGILFLVDLEVVFVR